MASIHSNHSSAVDEIDLQIDTTSPQRRASAGAISSQFLHPIVSVWHAMSSNARNYLDSGTARPTTIPLTTYTLDVPYRGPQAPPPNPFNVALVANPDYEQAVTSTRPQKAKAVLAEGMAESVASFVNFGVTLSYLNALARPVFEHSLAGQPYLQGLASAATVGPALAVSLMVGNNVINPTLKQVLGISVEPTDPQQMYPEPTEEGGNADRTTQLNRNWLVATQSAGRIGALTGDVSTYLAFGTAYGGLNALGTAYATPFASSVAAAIGGGLMATVQAAIAFCTHTRDGKPTHHAAVPSPTAVRDALHRLTVATTAEGIETQGLGWQARNLGHEFAVVTVASILGLASGNTFAALLGDGLRDDQGQDVLRGYLGVFFTVGTFFFATLSLGQRRGQTEGLFTGTTGALSQILPNHHPGSLEKLYDLTPGTWSHSVAGAIEGGYHSYRTAMTLPGHLLFDIAGLVTSPFFPALPKAGEDDPV